MNFNPNYAQFEPFNYKTLRDLKNKIKELGLTLPVNSNVEILKSSLKIEDRTIPNRLAVQPMEGFDAEIDGSPGELTYRRYKNYAKGGVGLIWFEATAIDFNCRSNPHQLVLTERNANQFKDLVSSTRKTCNTTLKELGFKSDCTLILQLNHSGRYSIKNGAKYPIRAYHYHELDNAIGISEKAGYIISDEDLKKVEDLWVHKALLAKKVGFDGVDIKSCHGYLIHELLNSRIRKNSIYGGEFLENRARLFLNIIKKLIQRLNNKKDFLIATRMSVYDGIPYPYGFGVKSIDNESFPASIDLSEPLELINKLYQLGIRLINVTAGNPHYKPYVTRPYDTPVRGGEVPNEHPLYGVNRLIALEAKIKKKLPLDMVIVGSGYSYLRQFAGFIAAGLIQENSVDICGFGRMALAHPNFPKQLFQEGIIKDKQVCITCSRCSQFMKMNTHVGCAVRDPHYKKKSYLSKI